MIILILPTQENIISNYVTDRNEQLSQLYQTNRDKNLVLKTNLMNNRNDSGEDPHTFKKGQTICIKTGTTSQD